MNNSKKLVIFDLDDTLHEAEKHLMGLGWNHLLAPWNSYFRDYGQDKTNLRQAPAPGLGVNTRQVIQFFINRLGIDLNQVKDQDLKDVNFDEKHIQELHALRDEELKKKEQYKDLDTFLEGVYNDPNLSDEGKLDYGYLDRLNEEKLRARGITDSETIEQLLAERAIKQEHIRKIVNVMERERISCLLPIVQKEGVKVIPGALEMVSRFKQAGYEYAIVTQSPLGLARAIFEKMGLIEDVKPGRNDGRDTQVIAGTMVAKPKPDKEPIQKAEWIVNWEAFDPQERADIRQALRNTPLGEKTTRYQEHQTLTAKARVAELSPEEKAKLKTLDEAGYGSPLTKDERKAMFGDLKNISPKRFDIVGIVGDSGSDVAAAKNMRDAGYPNFQAIIVENEFNQSPKAQEGLRKKGEFTFVHNLNEVTPAIFERPGQGSEGAFSPPGKERG